MNFKKTLIVWRRTDKKDREDEAFTDSFVHRDSHTYTIVDIDDLAQAIDVGFALLTQVSHILRHTQILIKTSNLAIDGYTLGEAGLSTEADIQTF